ncbi:hypothetical protein BDA96_10G143200 [Sorghum bicolor]|uniref:Glycosyltransferase n=1 Tax=Sorghum bicolor TaxID=4558 RepID=A0A921Q1P5_SORBI|nr:hypothetical protein BDA96_10G143200 [Sorghum bicolor]
MAPPPAPTMATVHGGRRRHVLLFPLPYQGHINPMFRLSGLLHARGFAVTVFHTQFNAPDPALHPDYRFVSVPNGSPTPVLVGIKDVVAQMMELGAACEAAFRDRLASVLEEYSRDAVACLVADSHLLPIIEVAARLSVPTLALRTGSATCCACFLAYPMLFDKGYLPVQESQRDMPVLELPPYRVRDLPIVGEDGGGQVRELISRATTAMKISSGLILNTFDALERRELEGLRRDLAVPVFDIGPLHKLSPAGGDSSLLLPDRSCLEWLDAWPPESVLYVSFGSVACMSPRDLVETAWGIAGSSVPFLWVVRPGMVSGSADHHHDHHLPEGFEAATHGRGMVVTWAPQEEVLGHRAVGGFWTHGGWNSTAESICEGVPMLCRPYFGDQMGNARYVEHVWRVGLEVGGDLERGSVEAAIRRLMTGDDGAEMRTRAGELKKAAAECTVEGGSSCLAIDKLITHMMSL